MLGRVFLLKTWAKEQAEGLQYRTGFGAVYCPKATYNSCVDTFSGTQVPANRNNAPAGFLELPRAYLEEVEDAQSRS